MIKIKRIRRPRGAVIHENSICLPVIRQNLDYFTFPGLSELDVVEHLFTTRTGGVSRGDLAEMNLSYSRGDDGENVLENYQRIARVLNCRTQDMVTSDQTHTVNIRTVTARDKGKGVVCARDYTDVDGLITDVPGICLVTLYADCVPLYFVDPVKRAIGLSHSGWKGTVKHMAVKTAEAMTEAFGCHPQNIHTAIGPSICQECYEVSDDVAEAFQEAFRGTDDILYEINSKGLYDCHDRSILVKGRDASKFRLDLWLCNLILLRKCGIPAENIEITDVCTCHNSSYLFSHRASGGKRGNLGAFLMLKKY